MTSKTVTARKELVLRLRIPLSQSGEADLQLLAAVGCGRGIQTGYNSCNRNHQQKTPAFVTANADADGSPEGCAPPELQGSDEQRGPVSFEGDIISHDRLSWMPRIAPDVRCRLLLAIEPIALDWKKLDRFDDPPQLLGGARQLGKAAAAAAAAAARRSSFGIIDDFCVHFSFELLKKMRDNKEALLAMAKRSRCLMYVRKTLLLRGTRHTRTFSKYFMCRVFCTSRTLLATFYRQLEHFDVSFGSRYQCKQNLPRVTLVPNRTVPENTYLRMTRQRLHKCNDYFGKMPLLADTYLTNMVAKLTRNYISETSLLARMVVVGLKSA